MLVQVQVQVFIAKTTSYRKVLECMHMYKRRCICRHNAELLQYTLYVTTICYIIKSKRYAIFL